MSKFDIYLNTEKPAVVEKLIDVYPFAGVCCNPQMVARLGRTDFANIVKELRAAASSSSKPPPMTMTGSCGMRKRF
jgi:hypothetical protein